jgi:SRR1
MLTSKPAYVADLGTASTADIPIYAQDPVFNTLDVSFLSSHLITVLPTPTALSHLTATTFLFAPHCERSFLLPVLGGHDPALVICNDIEASVAGYVYT